MTLAVAAARGALGLQRVAQRVAFVPQGVPVVAEGVGRGVVAKRVERPPDAGVAFVASAQFADVAQDDAADRRGPGAVVERVAVGGVPPDDPVEGLGLRRGQLDGEPGHSK